MSAATRWTKNHQSWWILELAQDRFIGFATKRVPKTQFIATHDLAWFDYFHQQGGTTLVLQAPVPQERDYVPTNLYGNHKDCTRAAAVSNFPIGTSIPHYFTTVQKMPPVARDALGLFLRERTQYLTTAKGLDQLTALQLEVLLDRAASHF